MVLMGNLGTPHVCSSDMSLCYFDLFTKLKETPSRGFQFHDVSHVRFAVGRSVPDIRIQHLTNNLQRLPGIWQKAAS
ncbi:hypothetical protein TNCV_5108441 [Trichonephila clavipes]|nr:hypothetical protein TNCV_5108441 [Trichonephila clavipes]